MHTSFGKRHVFLEGSISNCMHLHCMLIYVTCNVTSSFLCLCFSLDTVFSVPLPPTITTMAPSSVIVTSRFHESITRHALRSYLSEFISTFFYVFLVVGSGMSSRKLMPDASLNPTSLVVVAVASAFALSCVLYIAWDISGGHVNPAVTFAMAVGGHVSVPTAIFYWVAQLIASVMACLVLRVIVVGMHVPTYTIAEEMTGFGASVLEGILTFVLVYTVYAARDPRRGPMSPNGILLVGFVAGAGVLAAGPFSGGSMNPACAFGSATIAGSFRNQAVYWVGPLIGATIAGLLYDNVLFRSFPTELSEGIGV